VTNKNSRVRGVASLEYGLTIGVVVLLAAAMYIRSSDAVTGVWKQTTSTTMKSESARTITTKDTPCMGGAHGDSKICALAPQ
jgi:hypothetical protein